MSPHLLKRMTDNVEAEIGLSVRFVKHQGGGALLGIFIPDDNFSLIKNFLQDAISFFRWVETRNKVDKAIAQTRDPAVIAAKEERFIKWRDKVLAKFDSFVSSGLAIRPAMKRTKEYFNNEVTCGQIEIMARETGRLSKKRKK